jgi:hypothetical protein
LSIIARFETVQEASRAYEAAAAYFKESPDQAEKPEILQLVRELVQGQDADPHNSSSRSSKQRAVSPAPASWQQQTDLNVDDSFLPYPAFEQCDMYTQLQQCNSQDSISDASDPLMGVGCEGTTVADAAQTGCAAAAMEVEQPEAAVMNACCSWPAANGSPDMGDSCQAVSEVMMEEVMAQVIDNGLHAIHNRYSNIMCITFVGGVVAFVSLVGVRRAGDVPSVYHLPIGLKRCRLSSSRLQGAINLLQA